MIEKVIIISFCVFAIHYTMQEGEIFGRLGDFFYKHLPKKIHDPVFECPVCMVPYYGSAIYWLWFGAMRIDSLSPVKAVVFSNSVIEWPLVVIAAMGMNAILIKFFPHDDIKKI